MSKYSSWRTLNLPQRLKYEAESRQKNRQHLRDYHRSWSQEHKQSVVANYTKQNAKAALNKKRLILIVCIICRNELMKLIQLNKEINKMKKSIRQKRHYQQNKERIAATARARHIQDPVKHTDSLRQWRQRNPQKAHAQIKRRRATRANAIVNDFTDTDWFDVLIAYHYQCVYCGKRLTLKTATQDHITPLSAGGSHTKSNVVPACKSCNSRKHTGPPLRPIQPLLL